MPAPANLVHETSASTGTGNFTLTAQNGKQRFSTAFGTGATPNVFDYFISNQDAAEWERGTGHMSAVGTLVRDTVLESTNANAAVNFSAGTKDVTNDVPAAKQVTTEGGKILTGTLTFPNTGLHIRDTGGDNDYIIVPGENATADRTLTLNLNNADRTLSLPSPTFVNETLTGFLDVAEIAEPANPAANVARLRTIDDGAGVTTFGMRDASGNVVPMSHFQQLGTGAVTRTQQAKLREVVSILDFGGVGDGTTDNTAAFNAAAAALIASGQKGGTIHFPAGKFRFNSALTVTMPAGIFSFGIEGEGPEETILYFPTTAGITIACSDANHSCHVRQMAITCGTTNIGSGLKLTNSVLLGTINLSDITRVTFRGDDGPGVSKYWTNGIEIIGLSAISFSDVVVYGFNFLGNGISLSGNAATSPNYGIIYNLDRCTLLSLGVGLQIPTYIQGVSLSQCNITNCLTGIFVPPAAVGIVQIAVVASQFDCTSADIFIQSPIAGLIVTGNLFYVSTSGFGIVFTSTGFQNAITGNVFAGKAATTSTTGISVGGNITGSLVVGNTFQGLTVGVDLAATATWLVDKNIYDTVTTPMANLTTNRHGPEYTQGAGGSVTQATSKTTGVTLNKRCGQITMATGAVAAGATATFTLTNNTIAATDVVNVCVAGGGTANAYTADVVAVVAGSCAVQLRNSTAGSLTEAGILVNFAVIKSVIT